MVDKFDTDLSALMRVNKNKSVSASATFCTLRVREQMANTDWKGTPPAAIHDATDYYRIKAVWDSTVNSPVQYVKITSKISLNC